MSSSSNRRHFLISLGAVTAALSSTRLAAQAAPARLDEKNPQAVALGYVHDTTKVDNAKYPKHKADQKCSNCQLYQGKASDAWAACPLFPAGQVAADGWCSAWVKKPG